MNLRLCISMLIAGLCFPTAHAGDALFQTSTIDALMQGVYDGPMTIGQLKRHGNFGVGTFNGLDGEMIVFDGHCYQALADGRVLPVKENVMTPFAAVTFFHPTQQWHIPQAHSLAELQKMIDEKLPSKNFFYAVKITGDFSRLKMRSVKAQTPPYRPLVEVVKTQAEFRLEGVKGTLVGFRCPPYAQGVNVPGYHFHFLSAEKDKGGHLLDCAIENVNVEVDLLPEFTMALPRDSAFMQVDLSRHKAEDLKTVEQNSHKN